VLEGLNRWLDEKGLAVKAVSASPLRGPKGNLEFFLHIIQGAEGIAREELEREVRRAHG
jgi:predicted rRNA methylase YqxC with S4 and FtsJ domains